MAEAKIVVGAQDNASRVLSQVRSSMATLQDTSAKLTGALGALGLAGTVSVGGLALLAKNAIDSLDALNDLKDATGASIENISALEDVAKRTGTSFDTVGTSLVKFNAALKDSKPGSGADEALKAIGLSAKELKQIDPAEALLKTATALAGFADDGNKARLTQELFGKSLKEVAPFLKDLAEKGELNATVTTKQAEEAEAFNKQLFALRKNAEDAARVLTITLLPAVNDILRAYTSGGFKAAADQFGEALFGWTSNQQEKRIKNLTEDIAGLRKEFVGASSFAKQNSIGSEIDAKVAELKTLKAQYFKLTDGSVGGGRGNFIKSNVDNRDSVELPSKPDKGDKAKEKPFELKTDSLDSYIESLRKELEVKLELSSVEKTRNLIAEKGGNFSLEEAARAIGTAQQIDAAKLASSISETQAKTTAASEKYIEGLAAENAKLYENNEQHQRLLEELGLESEALNALHLARMDNNIQREKENLIVAQNIEGNELEIAQIERRIALLQSERDIKQKTVDKKISVDEATANKARALALTESIEEGILNGFRAGKDASSIFLDELKAQFAKTVLRPLIEPAAAAVSAGVSGLLGKLFSFDGGGYTGGGARSGGLDGKGGFLGMLHPNETVLDHTRGQGATSNVVYNFYGGVSRQEVMSGLQQVRAAAVGDVVDGQKRRRF